MICRQACRRLLLTMKSCQVPRGVTTRSMLRPNTCACYRSVGGQGMSPGTYNGSPIVYVKQKTISCSGYMLCLSLPTRPHCWTGLAPRLSAVGLYDPRIGTTRGSMQLKQLNTLAPRGQAFPVIGMAIASCVAPLPLGSYRSQRSHVWPAGCVGRAGPTLPPICSNLLVQAMGSATGQIPLPRRRLRPPTTASAPVPLPAALALPVELKLLFYRDHHPSVFMALSWRL